MSRIFLSHSSADLRKAVALKRWLAQQDPPLANDIFLDLDPDTGIRPGMRWKDALRQANARCEAVICLLSQNWERSHECKTEFRTAENLNKQIFCARLEPTAGQDVTAEWQRCDLFGSGPTTAIDVGSGPPVEFDTGGLYRLRDAIRGAGIGADSFVWPPPADPDRAPYRGWEPFAEMDAAVFFGRDAAIVRALDAVRGMRLSGVKSLFVVLGPSGSGKSSFLRAGLLPRLRREDRRFLLLSIVRPERNALTGDTGLARSIQSTRMALGLNGPTLGEIKKACRSNPGQIGDLLAEMRSAAADSLLDRGQETPIPTLILPLDQAEELFNTDAGPQAAEFLALLPNLMNRLNQDGSGLIVTATIRTDRYEVMQTHPSLAGIDTELFDELKPMPATQFRQVITGPAERASEAAVRLRVAPDLVDGLLADSAEGADTLPMLSLTLARLYGDYGTSGELSLAHYEAMGGMRQVVRSEIDEVLSTDPDERRSQHDVLRTAFIPWLATINPDNDQPMRRVARRSDLPEASHPLIDALVAKRLMVQDERNGQVVVEVALESLLRQWDELAGWLREQRQDLATADDIERAATAWERSARDESWLLAGTRLTDAEKLYATAGFGERLSGARDYLAASREREDEQLRAEEQHRSAELRNAQQRQQLAEEHAAVLRRRSRVLRAVVALTAVVAVVAATGLVLAVQSRQQAQASFRKATALKLTSEAQAMLAKTLPGGDVRAFQQLLAARPLTDSPDEGALLDTVIKRYSTRKVAQTADPILDLAFSPRGDRVATTDRSGSIRLWDAAQGQPIGEPLTGQTDWPNSVAFSPDGTLLAAGCSDGTVHLWDAGSGRHVGAVSTQDRVEINAITFADGMTVAAGAEDGTVRTWDARTKTPTGATRIANDAIKTLSYSRSGHRYVAGSGDTARAWSSDADQPLGPPLTAVGIIAAVAISPDGRTVATATSDLQLWNAESGKAITLPGPQHVTNYQSVAFSPDGRWVISGSSDGTLQAWNAADGQPVGISIPGHTGAVTAVAFSQAGDGLATVGYDGSLRVWNMGVLPMNSHEQLMKVAFSPDGRAIATVGTTAQLWDATTGAPIGSPMAEGAQDMAFAGGDRRIIAVTEDGRIEPVDFDAGRPWVPTIRLPDRSSKSAFSDDGRLVAITGLDGVARVFNTRDGALVAGPFDTKARINGMAFSPDGTSLVTSSIGVLIWDLGTNKPARILESEDELSTPFGVTFSHDGTRVAAAAVDGRVLVWDAQTGKEVMEPIAGHADVVWTVEFSPDGRMIATGSADNSVRLWSADNGQPLAQPFRGHTDMVTDVAFSADGRTLASASFDNTARIWPVVAIPTDLCNKMTANMSDQQWKDWVSPDIEYAKTCPDLPISPN